MKFDVLTLFPEMFDIMGYSIIGKAQESGYISINTTNMREFSRNKHKKVDDTPYGGGAGMVIRPDIICDAYNSVVTKKSKAIYLSPQGKTLTQEKVEELSKETHIILICGHYEGIDQRAIDIIKPEEISIGDYILTGGELPAMVLIDSISRYIQGVINTESIKEETFSTGLLEYPQYTRPETYKNLKVPDILLSGHHENIKKWRKEQSIKNTFVKRPELLKNRDFSKEEIDILEKIKRNEVPN